METSNLLKPEDSDEIPSTSNQASEAHQTSQEENGNPGNGFRNHNTLSATVYHCCYASHMIALIDMVWTCLEVFVVLLGTIPSDSVAWHVAVIFLVPNLIQFLAATMMYRKTNRVDNAEKLYKCCQTWLFLAFVTIVLHGAFITWTTITGIITKFLVFIAAVKLLWRFTALFFVNEFQNELEVPVISGRYTRIEDENNGEATGSAVE